VSSCKVLLSYDTLRDRHCVQGFLIPLPHVVVVPYTLSMLLGYPDTESGGDIDDDVLWKHFPREENAIGLLSAYSLDVPESSVRTVAGNRKG
jgi:hypothetical protein